MKIEAQTKCVLPADTEKAITMLTKKFDNYMYIHIRLSSFKNYKL